MLMTIKLTKKSGKDFSNDEILALSNRLWQIVAGLLQTDIAVVGTLTHGDVKLSRVQN